METHAVVSSENLLLTPEGVFLRKELLLRIQLQNFLLLLAVAVFVAFDLLSLARPETAWAAAAAHGAAVLAFALQWCHHGIRTKQIKAYLLMLDERGGSSSWEQWLPENRPATLMGSRWLVSTKGVFLGLQVATILVATKVSSTFDIRFFGTAMMLLLASAYFLLTNPKE